MTAEPEKLKFESEYFTLFRLAKSCYAAIEKENTLTGSNAGFVDLGDQIIVFDTFLSIDAAKDLIRAVKEETGKKIDLVINSHVHTDHIIGNQLFDVPIISTKQTKEAIENSLPETMIKLKALPVDFIERRKEEIIEEEDLDKKKNLKNELNFIENLLKYEIEVTLPNKIINENIIIEGKNGNAGLEIVENANECMRLAETKLSIYENIAQNLLKINKGKVKEDNVDKYNKELN